MVVVVVVVVRSGFIAKDPRMKRRQFNVKGGAGRESWSGRDLGGWGGGG